MALSFFSSNAFRLRSVILLLFKERTSSGQDLIKREPALVLFVEAQVFFNYCELLAKTLDSLRDLECAFLILKEKEICVDRVLEVELRIVLFCFFYTHVLGLLTYFL